MQVARAIDVRGKDVMMRRKEEMELPRRVLLLPAWCFLKFLVRSGDIIQSFLPCATNKGLFVALYIHGNSLSSPYKTRRNPIVTEPQHFRP